MSDAEPARKRPRTVVYGSDGMIVRSAQTIRRQNKAVAEARAAEINKFLAENPEGRAMCRMGDIAADERLVPDSAPQASTSGTNPRIRNQSDEVDSSDAGTWADVVTADAPLQADEFEHGALRLLSSPLDNSDPAMTMTTISDDDAPPIWSDNNESASLDDTACSDRSAAVNEPPTEVESSSSGTTDGRSSPIVADFDRNSVTADKLRQYICSDAGDSVMFAESNMKSWQVVLVILGLSTRFSLNGKARRGLIEAVKLFAGPRFRDWDISDYYMSKIFNSPDEATLYHFYCDLCCKELEKPVSKDKFKNHEAMCDNCCKSYKLNFDAPNYFVSIDLEYQVLSLLSLKVVNEDLSRRLLENFDSNERSGAEICDVYDGSLYKDLVSEKPADTRLFTCVFNTDGAPLFNSSKRAFWPILLVLNELSPRIRFRYPILAGMMVVRREPSPELMNTYMRPFVKALQRLGTVGFNAQVGEKTVHFVLKPLLCSVDSVARPLLQNRLQFNGYSGCSWCYAKGQHKHGCMRFLMQDPDPENRTHSEYIADVKAAKRKDREKPGKKKKSDVRGVRGNSVLTSLKRFDMIWAFVRDYLHADLIGVILQMFNIWNDPHCPIRLTKEELNKLNERLMRMTPPHEVHRLVRPLKTEKSKWKASEWRSWLLFYAIPCLTGILDDYALQHLALYVNSIYTLLQTSISEAELNAAERDLDKFVIIFEVLYGAKYVTFNVHSVRHVVDCVRRSGPLWSTSTFPFESAIHDLKQHVHGPRNVCEQMTNKSMQRNVYRSLLEEADDSPACVAFQKTLFGRTEAAYYARSGNIVFLGCNQGYCGAAAREFRNVHVNEIKTFRRCISSGMMIHSAAHDKMTLKSDDTVFRTDDGRFVQVLYLIKFREVAVAEVARFTVEKVIVRNAHEKDGHLEIGDVTINHLVKVVNDDDGCTKFIRITSLREKCVVMKVDDQTYISRLPNTVEIQ